MKFIAAQDRAYAIRFNAITRDDSEKRQQPYIVLGLDYFEEHEISDIKKAYRILALKFHPDKCKVDSLRTRHIGYIKVINNAY